MTWTWTADFFNSDSETDLENIQNNPNATQISFETFQFILLKFGKKCTWIEDVLKLKTNLENKIKMPQIQTRFVLKFTIHYKLGMT